MDLEKIIDVFSINHDGTIVNIDIEIEYLAKYFDESFSLENKNTVHRQPDNYLVSHLDNGKGRAGLSFVICF